MEKIAIFPGSFDPFTKGHEDIVLRGLKIFDEIVLLIAVSPNKNPKISLEDRLNIIDDYFHEN